MIVVQPKKTNARRSASVLAKAAIVALEPLENRRLMSADFGPGHGQHGGPGGAGTPSSTIEFSLAPTVVQTGLDSLATADGLADPASTTSVHLGNSNGVETYSVTLDGTGTVSTLTVDQLGDPVTAPTLSTTTFGSLGTSDSAAASELTTIASALGLTAPASTDTVNVATTSGGTATYAIHLTSSSNASTGNFSWGSFGQTISVDSAGNPVGDQNLPFSVFSTTIQNALNQHAPTGATALTSTSTQNVKVQTTDGITTYSTTFTTSGTTTTVTVNSAGTLTSLPTTTTTTFSALPTVVQTQLQTLATADGVTTSIAATQSVTELTETNGTILYSVSLAKTANGSSGSTYTFNVTVTVDSNGNPTVLPNNGFGFGNQGFGGPGGVGSDPGFFTGGNCNVSSGTVSNSSTGISSNSSSTAVTLPSSGSATASDLVETSDISVGTISAKLLSSLTSGLGAVSGVLAELVPTTSVDTTVLSDAADVVAAQTKLTSDTKALTKAQKKTLSTDEKGVASAIAKLKSVLAPLEKTMKSDAAKYLAELKVDLKAVSKDAKNATALAAAKATLASDESTAYNAIVKDGTAIETAIDTASGVVTAQAKLASDLPTIAADQTAIITAATQLVTDFGTELAASA
jgi:hypothetical protein